jgi:hypothetical protein
MGLADNQLDANMPEKRRLLYAQPTLSLQSRKIGGNNR